MVADIEADIDAAINKIKSSITLDRDAIRALREDISGKIEKAMKEVKKEQEKQKLAEEVRTSSGR